MKNKNDERYENRHNIVRNTNRNNIGENSNPSYQLNTPHDQYNQSRPIPRDQRYSSTERNQPSYYNLVSLEI